MKAEAFVGSMGLTFFCNKCVEQFYEFQKSNGQISDQFVEVCNGAIHAFHSLKEPRSETLIPKNGKIGLFNTYQEMATFEHILKNQESGRQWLDQIIDELKRITDRKTPQEERIQIAEKMQNFFDELGDYSYGALRESIETPRYMGA